VCRFDEGGPVEIIEVQEPVRTALVVRRVVRMDEIPEFLGEAFGRCVEAATALHKEIGGAPFAWYHGAPTTSIDVSAGLPVEYLTGDLPQGVEAVERPGGRAVTAVHLGPYDTLRDAYEAVESWMDERGLVAGDDAWEEYLTDPAAESDQSKWETRIVLPLST
jgi:effector-binding domain-containing protein